MTDLPPPQSKIIGKNIVIALAVMAVVIIALIAGVMMGLFIHPADTTRPARTPSPTEIPTIVPSPTLPTEFTFGTFNPESRILPPIVRGTTSSDSVLISLNGLWSEETKPAFSADTYGKVLNVFFFSLLFQEWRY